jgi:ubiquinone/menaquinone biosynthesis C-methylase UbiE
MERQSYPSDPRFLRFSPVKDWEEGVENESNASLFTRDLREVLEKHNVRLTPNAKVLEIGSGNSIFLNALQKEGYDAVGVDARPRGEKVEDVVAARIEQLPFKDESFELVVALSVFDSTVYKQNQQEMIREIARVLKHGGVVYAAINDTLDFGEGFEVLERGTFC